MSMSSQVLKIPIHVQKNSYKENSKAILRYHESTANEYCVFPNDTMFYTYQVYSKRARLGRSYLRELKNDFHRQNEKKPAHLLALSLLTEQSCVVSCQEPSSLVNTINPVLEVKALFELFHQKEHPAVFVGQMDYHHLEGVLTTLSLADASLLNPCSELKHIQNT